MTILISGPDLFVESSAEYGGPDYNLGKSVTVQWTWKLEEGKFATAHTAYFINARNSEGEMIEYDMLEDLSEEDEIQFYVQDLSELWAHETSDPFEGNSIDSAEMSYGEGSLMSYSTLEEAENMAISMAKSEQEFFYSPENF